ncbi:MAG: hypothetical protein JNM43_24180 [Planctomycetaceae bacterium]|nr:hypothetical protein [Planctomycetaceae bacterium]
MTKKQYVLASFLAALPAYGLVAAMLWSLFGAGMLQDGARVSAVMWVIFILTFLGGLVIGILPFAVLIFPGLMPIAAMAGAPAGIAPAASKASGKSKPAAEEADEEEYEEAGEDAEEYSDDADSGEQMFDEEPLDDFDDFEEEDNSSKKKKR